MHVGYHVISVSKVVFLGDADSTYTDELTVGDSSFVYIIYISIRLQLNTKEHRIYINICLICSYIFQFICIIYILK